MTPAEKLDVAIQGASVEASLIHPAPTSVDVAQRLYRNEPQTFEPFIHDWVIEKLAGLIAKYRAKLRRLDTDPAQASLPGFEDFQALPIRLPLLKGTAPKLKMTISMLKESMVALRHKFTRKADQKCEQIQSLVALMAPYAQIHKPLSVEKYFELVGSGVIPQPAPDRKTPEELSAIAKGRWAKLSKAERKAIARKREVTKAERRYGAGKTKAARG